MALSGSYQVNISTNNTYALRIEYTASQSIDGNYSIVNANIYVVKTGSNSQTYDLATNISLWIDGTQKISGQAFRFDMRSSGVGATVLLCSSSQTIYHNSDGTRSFNIRALWQIDTSAVKTADITTPTQTLDTIPRGSIIGTLTPFNLEEAFSIPITRYSASFTDTLTMSVNGTTIISIANYTSGQSIMLTNAQILAAYGSMTGKTATANFVIETKSGSTSIGVNAKSIQATARGTMRIKVNGNWIYALPWVKTNGIWRKSIASIRNSGTWNRGK